MGRDLKGLKWMERAWSSATSVTKSSRNKPAGKTTTTWLIGTPRLQNSTTALIKAATMLQIGALISRSARNLEPFPSRPNSIQFSGCRTFSSPGVNWLNGLQMPWNFACTPHLAKELNVVWVMDTWNFSKWLFCCLESEDPKCEVFTLAWTVPQNLRTIDL